MDVQLICLRSKQSRKKSQKPALLKKEDIQKLKNGQQFKSMTSAELCTACKLMITSSYNSKREINLLSAHKSCHLKYLIQDTLQVANFDMMIQEPYSLPNKSVYCHLNEVVLYPDASTTNSVDYSDKNVLLVGCGSVKRMPVLKSLTKLNFKKFVCLNRERSWAHNYFDDWIYAENEDVSQKEAALQAIKSYCETNNMKFDAILTYDDYCVLTTAYIQKELGMPGAIPFEFLEHIKNKYEFRNMCRKLNISAPKFFLIRKEDFGTYSRLYKQKAELQDANVKEFVADIADAHSPVQIEFPLIVKNIFGSGKDFVKKCSSLSDFCETLSFLDENHMKIDIIVEEFFEGHEIDMDILIQDNQMKFIAISDNLPPLEPWFYEQGGMLPSIYLTATERRAIETIAAKWISKMDFQGAVLHFEARCRPSCLYRSNLSSVLVPDANNNLTVDEDAYYNFLIENESLFIMPIEINPRLGGAECWSMAVAAYDINMIQEYVNICLGRQLNQAEISRKQSSPRNQCISKDFHPAINTKINAIHVYLDQLKRNPNAIEINIFRSPGDTLTYKDYVGFVTVLCNPYDPTVTSESLDELIQKRQKILDLITFDLASS